MYNDGRGDLTGEVEESHLSGDPAARPFDTGGIPFRERVFSRVFLRAARWSFRLPALTRCSAGAVRRVEEIAGRLPDEVFARRVHIRRVAGIEESTSRWSLAEVVEHLLIVNRRVAAIVRALGSGADPGPMWTILDVKPKGRPLADLRREIAGLPIEIEAAAAGVSDWRSPLRHPHAWFGSLDAREWWALNALHNQVHRRQAERIHGAAGLPGSLKPD